MRGAVSYGTFRVEFEGPCAEVCESVRTTVCGGETVGAYFERIGGKTFGSSPVLASGCSGVWHGCIGGRPRAIGSIGGHCDHVCSDAGFSGHSGVGPRVAGVVDGDKTGGFPVAGGNCERVDTVVEPVEVEVVVSEKTLANRAKRRAAKARKLRKQSVEKLKADLPPVVEIASDVPEWRRGLGRNGKPLKEDGVGFWRSCAAETRSALIESKAAMHIAENQRKTREARNRIAYLDSPQAIVDQVTGLIAKAHDIAAKEGDEKVMGWAKTVTNSSAESLARSVPSTVPSFESVSSAVDEAIKLEQARAACAKEEADQENMRRAAELEATNVQLKETIARLEREAAARAADRKAPIPVKQARAAVPDVNCAPVRRSGETVAEHLERFRKYLEIRDGIQKGGSSAFVFKP